MASSTSDFERFLYANYPDDYRKVTTKGVPDDVMEAILSRHRSHYDIWKDIPEWVKSEYGDKLPSEVLNGNITPRQFVNKEIEENSVKNVNHDTIFDLDFMDFGMALIAKGYSYDAVATMAKNRATRNQIWATTNDGQLELTEEQKALWRETRESDKTTITNDWKYNQPEKYLMHIVKEMSREYKRAQREGREPSSEKIDELTNELKHYLTGLETTEDKTKLMTYLRQEPQQAALKQMDANVLQMFTGMLEEKGIRITPTENTNSRANEAEEESLSQSLENDFIQMQKMKNILINKYNYQNDKSSVREVLHSNDGVSRLLAMKRNGASRT